MNNDISKRYKFSLDSKSNNTLNNGQLLFNYGDDVTLEITVIDDDVTKNIAGCEVDLITANQNSTDVLIHRFSDGGITVREDNTIVIVCKSDYVDRLGTNVGQLIIRDEDQSITTQMFSYQTSTTLVSDEISGSVDGINTIEDIMKVIANANLEIENFNRVTTGLESKIQATNTLVDNLTDRVNIEITSTNSIVNQVKLEESKRVQSEDARSSNETSRVNSETNRIQEEYVRVANEQDRVLKETQRVENETTRVSEENIRKTNEIARVEAEEYRSTKFQEMEQVYASSASEVENNRQGYDGTVYANMYEARKADYKMLEDTILTNDNVVWTNIEGENLSIDYTKQGHLREVEIWGNTIQGYENLITDKILADSVNSVTWNEAYAGINPLVEYNEDSFRFKDYCGSGSSRVLSDIQNSENVNFIQLKPNTKYSLSVKDNPTFTNFLVYSLNAQLGTQVFTTDETGKVIIILRGAHESNSKFNIRLVEGNIPELPTVEWGFDLSDIQHLGELYVDNDGEPILDSEGREQYKIEVESCNKNLSPVSRIDNIKGYNSDIVSMKIADLKLLKNKTYTISRNMTASDDNRLRIYRYDDESKLYNLYVDLFGTGSASKTFTTSNSNYEYIITAHTFKTDANSIWDIQLELGNKTDPIPNQSHKTTILLPCQLMKVGDVKDRLYWDSNKNKYIVEKNIGYEKLCNMTSLGFSLITGYENSLVQGFRFYPCSKPENPYKSTNGFAIIKGMKKASTFAIDDKEEFSYGKPTPNYVDLKFKIAKSKLKSLDLTGLNEYFANNDFVIFYNQTPQLIETNISEPIKIPTYIDKTHLFVTGGIDGTIKAKVPIDGAQAIQSLSSENKELNNQISTLSVENEELKATNEVQDELIDVTMCATDEMFNMLEPLLTQVMKIDTLNTNNKDVVNPMADLYVAMVQRGLKTIDQVPARYREQVEAILAELDK